MKEISIKLAQLHNSLFLGGTNHQMHLDPTKRLGLKLTYNRPEKELIVEFNGHVAIIPSSNVASMSVTNPIDIGIKVAEPALRVPKTVVTHVNHPQVAGIASAQVEDPTQRIQNVKAGETDYVNFRENIGQPKK